MPRNRCLGLLGGWLGPRYPRWALTILIAYPPLLPRLVHLPLTQGLRIRLREQPSQLLLMLLDPAGEVVSREEIRRKLWPPDTFVDFDQSLGTALRKVRQALCDDAETPRYIGTIPKHGFRFVAVERISSMPQGAHTVLTVSTSQPSTPEVKQEQHPSPGFRPSRGCVRGSMCAFALLGWLVRTRSATPELASDRQLARPIPSSVLPPSNWFFEDQLLFPRTPPQRLHWSLAGPPH
jgi:DNA-binding winged helix-turn-helix (wHTH) protein